MRRSSARLKPLMRWAIGLTSRSCSLSGSKRNRASPASSKRVTDSSSAVHGPVMLCADAISRNLYLDRLRFSPRRGLPILAAPPHHDRRLHQQSNYQKSHHDVLRVTARSGMLEGLGEIPAKVGYRRVTLVGIAGQSAAQHRVQGDRQARVALAGRHIHPSGKFACEELVAQGRQRKHVAAPVKRQAVALLRRAILERPLRQSKLRERSSIDARQSQAEISDLDGAVFTAQNVFRFEIEVEYALVVDVDQSLSNRIQHRGCPLKW